MAGGRSFLVPSARGGFCPSPGREVPARRTFVSGAARPRATSVRSRLGASVPAGPAGTTGSRSMMAVWARLSGTSARQCEQPPAKAKASSHGPCTAAKNRRLEWDRLIRISAPPCAVGSSVGEATSSLCIGWGRRDRDTAWTDGDGRAGDFGGDDATRLGNGISRVRMDRSFANAERSPSALA